jgi:hypothetical protein
MGLFSFSYVEGAILSKVVNVSLSESFELGALVVFFSYLLLYDTSHATQRTGTKKGSNPTITADCRGDTATKDPTDMAMSCLRPT